MENDTSKTEIDNVTKYAQQLQQIQAVANSIKIELAPTELQMQHVEEEIKRKQQEFNDSMLEMRNQKRQLENERFDVARKLKQVQADVDKVQRQLDQALAAKKAEEELAAQAEKLRLITAGAPWREWAKDHQITGAHFLSNAKRGIIADTMGLGKTLTLTATLDIIRGLDDNAGKRILYYSPAPVVRNVVREVRRWAPHRSVVPMGGQDKRTRRFQLETLAETEQFVVVVNYEASRKDNSLIDDLASLKLDTVIVDEAHNIKDMKSKAFRDIKRLIDQGNVPYVFLATGTPILNRPQELFSLLHLIDPYVFYREYTFLSDYCMQVWDDNDKPRWTFRPGGLDMLAHKIRNRYIRRDRHTAGLQLPKQTVQIHEIELDPDLYPKQYAAYSEMRDRAMIVLDPDRGKAIRPNIVLTWYLRLRQLMVWPDGIEVKDPEDGELLLKLDTQESCKIDYIINGRDGLLPELEGERVAIFSQFKAPLKELERRCKDAGIRAVVLDGDTPDNLRDCIALDFDRLSNTNEWDVVICNYRVGGIGLNFTACTQTIILDEEWNPGKRDQAYGRTDRIGQTEETTVHVLRVAKVGDRGGIDSWLAGIIDHKEGMIEGFDNATALPNPYEAFQTGLI